MEKKETDERGASESEVEKVFDDSFKEASGDKPAEVETPKKPEAEVHEEEVKPKEEVVEKIEKLEVKETPEEDEKVEQRYKTLQGIHRHDKEEYEKKQKDWETEKGNLLKELDEAKKKVPEKPEKPEKPEGDDEALTPEEQERLKQYEQDFDLVAQMEGAQRRVALAKLRKSIVGDIQAIREEFTTKLSELGKIVTPVTAHIASVEDERHFSAIRDGYRAEDGTVVQGHEDWDKFLNVEHGGDGSIRKWIDTKPKYMQSRLNEIYDKGNAVDIIDMISDFKHENNIVRSESDVIDLDKKRSEKKKALATVVSRGRAVNAGVGGTPDDFDGSFDEAVKKTGG